MLAVVMSGAGNFGALQVGALETLLEGGVQPDMAVGTSAGAINAIYFASDPTLEGVRSLGRAWQPVGEREVGIPALLAGVRRLITREDSLVNSMALAEFLVTTYPAEKMTISNTTMPTAIPHANVFILFFNLNCLL